MGNKRSFAFVVPRNVRPVRFSQSRRGRRRLPPRRAPRRPPPRRRGGFSRGFGFRNTLISNPGVSSSGNTGRILSSPGQGEFWFSTTGDTTGTLQTKSFDPGNTGMLVLDATAKAYDSYIVHRAEILIKGRGPTTSTSSLFLAVDFDPATKANKRDLLLQFQPSASLSAYQAHRMIVPRRSIMRRNMYVTNGNAQEDSTAFLITYSAILPKDDTTVWEIWVRYNVEFIHPAPLNS